MTIKKTYLLYLLYILLFWGPKLFGQQNELDSLRNELKKETRDTTRVQLKYVIGDKERIARSSYFDSLIVEAKQAGEKQIEAFSYLNLGQIYYDRGEIMKAMEHWEKSKSLSLIIHDKQGIATSLNDIALIYESQGDIPKALDYYLQSVKVSEESGQKNRMAFTYNNIGLVYFNQGDKANAIKYYEKGVKLFEELGNKKGLGFLYINIGLLYTAPKDTALALRYFKGSVALNEEIDNKGNMATALTSMGNLYFYQMRDYKTAFKLYTRSLAIQRALGRKQGIATLFINLASVYIQERNYSFARKYADSSLFLSKELGFPKNISPAESKLYIIDSATGNLEGAFAHYKQYIIYRDSIKNESTRKASIKSQLKYEFDKKEAVITEQREKERLVAEEKSRFQQIVIWSVALGLFMVAGFAFFVLKTLKLTKHQKVVIEEKQREIIDSIRYAKRIQRSLLPTEKYMERSLNRLRNNK